MAYLIDSDYGSEACHVRLGCDQGRRSFNIPNKFRSRGNNSWILIDTVFLGEDETRKCRWSIDGERPVEDAQSVLFGWI